MMKTIVMRCTVEYANNINAIQLLQQWNLNNAEIKDVDGKPYAIIKNR